MFLLTATTCMSLNIYHEARSTSDKEQMMVNKVVMARAKQSNTDACAVVFKKGQFSWTYGYKPKYKFKSYQDMLNYYNIKDENAWRASLENVVKSMYTYDDKKDGKITFYHDKTIKKFDWNKKGKYVVAVAQTKNFVFYRPIIVKKV